MIPTITREQARKRADHIRKTTRCDRPHVYDAAHTVSQITKYFPEFEGFQNINYSFIEAGGVEYFEDLSWETLPRLDKDYPLDFDYVLDRRFNLYINEYIGWQSDWYPFRDLPDKTRRDRFVIHDIWDVMSFGRPLPKDMKKRSLIFEDLHYIWACNRELLEDIASECELPTCITGNIWDGVSTINWTAAALRSGEYLYLADIPKQAGMDYAITSYFEGVPVEHIVGR